MNGLLGLNCRVLGVSRDMIMSAVRQIGGVWMLVHDDPELVTLAKAAGIRTIYRQSGDETLATPPDVFVQTRAEKQADLVYLTNELDPTPELLDWTRRAIDYATPRGIKLCIFNFATDRSASQWASCRSVAAQAISGRHAIGCHVYQRTPDPNGSFNFLELKRELGGLWLTTEYAFYVDAYHGWRGVLSPAQYGAFLDATLPLFQREQMPVLLFSGDNWPANAQGKASGFGVLDNAAMVSELARVNKTFTWSGTVTQSAAPDRTTLGDPVLATVTSTAANIVNIRADTSTSAAILATFKTGDTITLRPTPTSAINGWNWYAVEVPVVGWSASVFKWVAGAADQPIVKLSIPFVSQSGIGANKTNEDCGAACAVSKARYRYQRAGFADPVNFTVDDFAMKTRLATADNGLTPPEVAALLTGYGVRAVARRPLLLSDLITALEADDPPIILVNYKWLNPNHPADLGHFVIVYAYGENGFWYNDPYLLGAGQYVTNDALTKAMSDVSTFAAFPNQGVTLVT